MSDGRSHYLANKDMLSLPNETQLIGGRYRHNGSTADPSPQRIISQGVTPDIAPAQTAPERETNSSGAVWFLMRVSYGRERRAAEFLAGEGIEVFLPTITRIRIKDGRKRNVEESLIPNFLFVKSTEDTLLKYIGKPPLDFLHHYYVPARDREGNPVGPKGMKPLVVPAEQMEQFRIWNSVDNRNKFFTSEIRQEFSQGERVKVVEGMFAGLSGHVTRIKRQLRVGISIEGIGTVFTAYIPKDFLVPLDT